MSKKLAEYLDKMKGKLVSCAMLGIGAEIPAWTGVLEDYTDEAVILQHEGEKLIVLLNAIAYIRPREK